jgi:hypothetical protein
MLLVGGWLRWPGDCSWSRLTALLFVRLLGVLHFTLWGVLFSKARWNQRVDLAGSHLVFADLSLSLVTLRLTKRATRTALLEVYVLTGASHLSNRLTEASFRISVLMSCGGPKCRHYSQQYMNCCDCWLPRKSCLSGCCLDTDLCNCYLGSDLVTCGRIPWKAPPNCLCNPKSQSS